MIWHIPSVALETSINRPPLKQMLVLQFQYLVTNTFMLLIYINLCMWRIPGLNYRTNIWLSGLKDDSKSPSHGYRNCSFNKNISHVLCIYLLVYLISSFCLLLIRCWFSSSRQPLDLRCVLFDFHRASFSKPLISLSHYITSPGDSYIDFFTIDDN